MLLSHTYNLIAHVLIEQESRATQVGTLEGRLHGTELALARAREELARYRSAQGDLNQSLDQVGVVHVNKTYSVNKINFIHCAADGQSVDAVSLQLEAETSARVLAMMRETEADRDAALRRARELEARLANAQSQQVRG
jgi:hypothetical protein